MAAVLARQVSPRALLTPFACCRATCSFAAHSHGCENSHNLCSQSILSCFVVCFVFILLACSDSFVRQVCCRAVTRQCEDRAKRGELCTRKRISVALCESFIRIFMSTPPKMGLVISVLLLYMLTAVWTNNSIQDVPACAILQRRGEEDKASVIALEEMVHNPFLLHLGFHGVQERVQLF